MSRSLSRLFFVLIAASLAGVVLGVVLINGGRRGSADAGLVLVLGGFAFLGLALAARTLAVAAAWEELRARILQVLAAAARRGDAFGAALEALGREHDGPAGQALRRMLAALDGGGSLEGAMEAAGTRLFTGEDRAAVRSVAGTARAGQMLEVLAGERVHGRRAFGKAGLALVYAIALLVVGSFVGVNLVPMFRSVFEQTADKGLAPGARELADAAFRDLGIVDGTVPWLLAAAAVAALFFVAQDVSSRTEGGRRRWRDRLLLLPGFGGVVRLRATERVGRVLGFLVADGVPFHDALARAAETAGVPSLERSLDEAAAAVAHGEPIPRALEGSRLPRFAVDRVVAASAGGPASFGPSITALARECGVRAQLRAEGLLATLYPVVLLLGGAAAFLTFRGVFRFMESIRDCSRPW